MKRTLFTAFLILVTTILFSQQSQPFGLRMGMTLSEVRSVYRNIGMLYPQHNLYRIEPPRNQWFIYYFVKIHPEYGLYYINGITDSYRTNEKGSEFKLVFDQLVKQVSSTYGDYELFDYIKLGSTLNNENEWMISLTHRERVFEASWEKYKGSNMPEDISKIIVRALGHGYIFGALEIEYFSLYDDETYEENILNF